ncbi:MAG: tetratricopeptide repeat protein [Verrucomicrobiales bacterium]|nr:tetratricopeptide repeat protein [Verrucomicrobiales bacterium]
MHPALGVIGLVLLTFAAHAPALTGGFVWDDLLLIRQNPLVTGEGRWISIWFQTDFPLSTMTWAVLYGLFGERAAGYHLVNVALHALNALLVWRVLATLGARAPLLAAALFAVHPVAVASAGWVSELKNTLALAFALLAALCFFKSETARASTAATSDDAARAILKRRGRAFYTASVLAFALALASKTAVVTVPLVLLGCMAWQRGRLERALLWRTAPFFALSLVFGLVTLKLQTFRILATEPVQTLDLPARLAAAGSALWFYLGKALLPLNLMAVYPQGTPDARTLMTWLPLASWCGVLAACAAVRRPWARAALLALGAFTVLLAPVLGVVDMYFLTVARVSDHFAYPALIGLVALLAAAIHSILPKRLFTAASALLVGALAVLCFQRARVYASDEALWADTLAKNPGSWLAHNNLGCIRAEQNRLVDAARHFESSLRLNPRNSKALVNLARVRLVQGDAASAESLLKQAVELRPNDADAHAHLGRLRLTHGRPAEAEPHLRRALELRPDMTTRLELARACHALGRTGEAMSLYREALRRDSNQLEAMNNLAWLLATVADARLRNGAEALRLAERACALTSRTNAQMLGVLAAALAETGRFAEAAATAATARDVARASGDAHLALLAEELRKQFELGQPFRMPSHSQPAP